MCYLVTSLDFEMAADSFHFKQSLKDKNPYPILRYVQIERYVTRPLASLIVRAVYRTRTTPNQLTVASLVIGLGAGGSYLGGTPFWFALAGMLVFLSSIVDCADGMLARSKDQCTRFGLFLDLFCDRIVDFAILAGIALGYYIYSGNTVLCFLGLINVGLYLLQVILHMLMKDYTGSRRSGEASEAHSFSMFAVMVLSLINRLDLIIVAVAAGAVLSLIIKAALVIRLGREKDPAST